MTHLALLIRTSLLVVAIKLALFVKIVVTLFKQPALLLYSPDVPD